MVLIHSNYARDLVNQKELIIYKTKHKQVGRKHDYNVYKKNHPELPKDVMTMFDLGFLGVKDDYPEQKSLYLLKRKRTANLLYSKKSTTENILGEG